MGRTVDRMLKSVGLDAETVVSAVEEDEDNKLTVTILLSAVLLICLLPLLSVVGSGVASSVVVPSCCVAGSSVATRVVTSSWALVVCR